MIRRTKLLYKKYALKKYAALYVTTRKLKRIDSMTLHLITYHRQVSQKEIYKERNPERMYSSYAQK